YAMAQTREALILAGLAEFVEHGFDSPSLDRICSRAGFTRGAFYVHFENREDFIVAVMEARLSAFFNSIIGGAAEEGGFAPVVRRFTSAVVELVNSGAQADTHGLTTVGGITIQLHRMIDAAERSPRIRSHLVSLFGGAIGRVTEMVEIEQASGEMHSDIDPTLLAELLVALSIGSVTAAEAGLSLQSERAGEALIQLMKPR
ncbi:MAG: TetR/AcrR family transcriptional regulator, partial [Deltaproteobacteria bacterium]|nr:TetR/AcrR family transcriptional regulator [Deltaproteobacteria bacterium]